MIRVRGGVLGERFLFLTGKKNFFFPKHPDKPRGPTGFRRRFPGNVKVRLMSNSLRGQESVDLYLHSFTYCHDVVSYWAHEEPQLHWEVGQVVVDTRITAQHKALGGKRTRSSRISTEFSKCLHSSLLNGTSPSFKLIYKWKQVAPVLQGFQLKFVTFMLCILLSNENWKWTLVCPISQNFIWNQCEIPFCPFFAQLCLQYFPPPTPPSHRSAFDHPSSNAIKLIILRIRFASNY